jgi:oxygen-independent coproporphyrinogen-3 oxidase
MLSIPLTSPCDDGSKGFGLYIHWPFCQSKCPYCDFNSHVRDQIDEDAWAKAYVDEILFYKHFLNRASPLTSVFFGGGTPSRMQPRTVEKIIMAAKDSFGLIDNAEITLEANPTSTEADKFKAFQSAGINRVSLGIQALNDKDLAFLGRQHNSQDAMRAIDIAASIFNRYSFDLIYARPEQTPKAWQDELTHALSLAATHLSLYQLTIEEGTAFHTLYARKAFDIPNHEDAGVLYELTHDLTRAHGLQRYEISNHARPGHHSRHNMTYWRYGDYIGVGPGAHGRLSKDGITYATRAHRAPEIWLERVQKQGHGAHDFEMIAPQSAAEEYLMMALRTVEGVELERLSALAQKALDSFIDHDRLTMLEQMGFMKRHGNQRLIATREGQQRLSSLLPQLLR